METVLAALTLMACAAPVSTRYVAESWSVRDGLPQSSVTDVDEDVDGYIWVSTFGGVARFDGRSFRRADPPGTHGDFDGHRFSAIAVDGDRVYAGSEAGRLFVFSRHLRESAAIEVISFPRAGIIRDLAVGADGTLWVAADNAGVFALPTSGPMREIDLGEAARGVHIDGEDVVVVGQDALFRIRPDVTVTAERAPGITDADVTPDGIVLADSAGLRGLGRPAPNSSQRAIRRVRAQGPLWWIAGHEGLSIVDAAASDGAQAERRITVPTPRATGARAANATWIHRIFVARDGAVWVGSSDVGLIRVRDRGVRQLGQQVGLDGNSVLLAAPLSSGGALISAYCSGLQRLTLRGTIERVDAVASDACVASIHVEGDDALFDLRGELWRLDAGGATKLADRDHVGGGSLLSMARDGSGYWLGTSTAGVVHLDQDGHQDRWLGGARPTEVRRLIQRPDGSLVVGASDGVYVTVGDELRRLSPEGAVLRVRDIVEARSDELWVATYGNGFHVVSASGAHLPLYESEGFCDDVVSRIILIDDRVWFNGNRGAFWVTKASIQDAIARRRADAHAPLLLPCFRIDTGEGNGGGEGAGGVLADGRLALPTVDGIALVDAVGVHAEVTLPPVRIESASVDGFPLDVDGFTRVPPGPHHLTVNLATPALSDDSVLFERRLSHDDGTRHETSSSYELDYVNLAPGAYRLDVRRTSLDGRQGPLTTLRFELTPRLTETVAFRVGAPGVLVAALVAAVSVLLNGLRARNRALLAEVERDAVYRSVFESSPCAMFVHDANGGLVELNAAAIAIVGPQRPLQLTPSPPSTSATTTTPTKTIGRVSPLSFVAADHRDAYRTLVQGLSLRPQVSEVKMLTPEGTERVMLLECTRLVMGGVPRTLVAALDITAIRAAEAERAALLDRHSTSIRLEGLGRLAGGIAHDFNNVLAALRLQVDVLATACHEPQTVHELSNEMRQTVDHGRDLTRRFLIFGRESGQPEQVVVLDAIERCAPLLRRLLRSEVTLDIQGVASNAVVRVDPAHLDQMLMNLVLNAQGACGPLGAIVVRLARNEPLPEHAHEVLPAPTGPVVRLSVQDNGAGMTQEVLTRAFEPFFSTKGVGSGIGLTVVQRVAESTGAGIHIVTAPGVGTTLFLSFPDSCPETETAPPAVVEKAEIPQGPTAFGPSETPCILVVDDEAFVREALARLLRRFGYVVVTAVDGVDALRVFAEVSATRRVDLLLTDLLMPNMGGIELIEAMAKTAPTLPVVVLSGYSGGDAPPRDVVSLEKPVEPLRLRAVVHQLVPLPKAATTTT